MKLADLNPRWWADGDGRTGMGITFDCPGACCASKLPTSQEDEAPYDPAHPFRQRLGVAFANPMDGGVPEDMVPHHDGAGHITFSVEPEWQRTGDGFDTLTLSPSVDTSKYGHWHGFVTAGEIR